MDNIVLNSTNRVANSTNRFEYNLPSATKFGAGDEVSLQSISIFNSIFNVESLRGNNSFSIIWNGATPVTYNFTLPDGFYDVGALNSFIQQQCVLNKLYMISGTNFVYFVELTENSVQYSVQLNSYAIPTSAQATAKGWTMPAGVTWSFPTTAQTPQMTITSAFGKLIGFNAGTYPSAIQATDIQILSAVTPQISTVNSIVIGCNLVHSPYSNVPNVMYAIPIKTVFGGQIVATNTNTKGNKIAPGLYSKVVIELYDQEYTTLRIRDFDVTILLSIVKGEK